MYFPYCIFYSIFIVSSLYEYSTASEVATGIAHASQSDGVVHASGGLAVAVAHCGGWR